MIPPPAIKEALRQRALALGFDDCRFTTADPPASLPQFRQWLADGRHGEMHYLSRGLPKRANPGYILPSVRSIIVLAAAHHPAEMPIHQGPVGPTVDAALTGYVARYARHPDYHRLLAKPLHELAQTADRLGGPGTRSLAYVDTGPILERDLAQRAGLGFVGKHTNLIRRRAGNWFFLAEVLTTLELPADPSEHNRCGQCTRCLAACPTRAITAPFQLDARLCIAYLTIEFRGIIPHELRPAMGCRIFGCDDCLEVCPWNRFAQTGRLLQSTLRPDLVHPNLLELLSLDDDAFRHRFRDTPLWRARRPGLRRNVCIALGNLKDPRALPALEHATHDSQPVVAEAARWALDQIASPAGPTPASPRLAAL